MARNTELHGRCVALSLITACALAACRHAAAPDAGSRVSAQRIDAAVPRASELPADASVADVLARYAAVAVGPGMGDRTGPPPIEDVPTPRMLPAGAHITVRIDISRGRSRVGARLTATLRVRELGIERVVASGLEPARCDADAVENGIHLSCATDGAMPRAHVWVESDHLLLEVETGAEGELLGSSRSVERYALPPHAVVTFHDGHGSVGVPSEMSPES